MPGVQTLLPVMITLAMDEGLLSLQELAKLTSRNPAQLYGIEGKGELREGFDADLAIVDLKNRFVVKRDWIGSKCCWTPFEGASLLGLPVHTIVNGRFAVRDGRLSDRGPGAIPTFQ